MSREEKQQSQQAELQKQLWSIANSLRGNMDANDFKNYILGLIFYRYLSENLVNYVENVIGSMLGDSWTTKVSMGYRSFYIEIGLKAIDPERIGKFTFEFGQSFEIHWDGYGFGKQNPTLEMNVGTTGAFNLFGDGIRTEFYRGVAAIANNKEFLQDLMAHITIADEKTREISKLYDECKNKLDNPILP